MKQIIDFDNWMREKVQSVHYSNNEEMNDAYERILINNTKL